MSLTALFPDTPGKLYIETDGGHTETPLMLGDIIAFKPETGVSVERTIEEGKPIRLLFQFPGKSEHVRRWPVEQETIEENSVDLLILDFALTHGFDIHEVTDTSWKVIEKTA